MTGNNFDFKTKGVMIGKDIPWRETKGQGFRVKQFTPIAMIEEGEIKEIKQYWLPFAILEVECPYFNYGDTKILLPIVHRLDFRHCWELYKERSIELEEEVIISYSPPESKIYRLFGKTFPHLRIEVRPKGSLEKIYDMETYNGLSILEILNSVKPIEVWKPFEGRTE